jgi:hypothetical protein
MGFQVQLIEPVIRLTRDASVVDMKDVDELGGEA